MNLDNFSLPVIYIIFIVGMLFLSIAINGILIKFSKNLGAKNEVDQVRWAATTKPAFGGVSFFILFLSSIVFYSIFFGNGQILMNSKFIVIVTVCSLGFIMGLADDAYNTKPFLKFAVQFICAFLFIISGNGIHTFQYEWVNVILTFFWIVGIMNSINMLDNMDAITASVSTVICVALAMVLVFRSDFLNLNLILLLGVMAGLTGFLYYNWNPSRMYMGDSGSQFLGAFLGGMAIEYLWNAPDYLGHAIPEKQLLLVALIFVVPLSDTVTVSFNRIKKGQSPFVGGRDHTTHHLSYMGLSDRHIAMLLITISLSSLFMGIIIINNIETWQRFHSLLFATLFIVISGALYSTTIIGKPKSKT